MKLKNSLHPIQRQIFYTFCLENKKYFLSGTHNVSKCLPLHLFSVHSLHGTSTECFRCTFYGLSGVVSHSDNRNIHPSIFYTRLIRRSGREGAGAYPSGHRARGGIHPGQVASPSQGHTTPHAHTHTERQF